MGRILAIDYGRKRCGVAVTDPERIIASPLTTVSTAELEKFLLVYNDEEIVDEFVVGYPRRLNNEPSEAVKYIDPFLTRLKKMFPGKKINLVDERFSSQSAMQAMIDGGVKKNRRRDKAMVDRISASIILQTYLNSYKVN
ncbi:MAG: Holliday junction resolvase RuvX [Bacteroidales bacterium]|nr:Holliday junction resolvase RuvX [Bacteroidales bacterium]